MILKMFFLCMFLLSSALTLNAEELLTEVDTSGASHKDSGSLVVKDESDDFLILDNGEGEELLILENDSSSDNNDSSLQESLSNTLVAGEQSSDSVKSSSDDGIKADDKEKTSPVIIGEESGSKSYDTASVAKKESPKIVVEDAESVNFLGNIDGYKSPKRAMLLSFLVPGLGQGYAGKPWKSALFGAIEVGLIAGAVKSGYEGRQAKNESRSFADSHYSVDRFNTFYSKYLRYVEARIAKLNEGTEGFDPVKETKSLIVDNYFIGADTTSFTGDVTQSVKNEMYEGWQYVQGWDDAQPAFDAIEGFVNIDTVHYQIFVSVNDTVVNTDTTWFISNKNGNVAESKLLGYSSNQNHYMDVVNRSQKYYGISQGFIMLIALNHVVSAVDALITAKAYNDSLVRKDTVWRHIHLDRTLAYSGNTGVSAGLNLRVMF